MPRKNAGNWPICKEHGLWWISQANHGVETSRVKIGDRLLFWISGQGFVGYGTVSGPVYAPTSREEVPWPGVLYRWGLVVPFHLNFDCPYPVKLKFNASKMEKTFITTYALRRGFSPIDEHVAEAAINEMFDVHARVA